MTQANESLPVVLRDHFNANRQYTLLIQSDLYTESMDIEYIFSDFWHDVRPVNLQ